MAYALVALLGAVVGVSELLFRYRDDPGHSLTKVAALSYVAFNAAASAGALVLIRALHLDFGKTGSAAATAQILVASFGSIAFFRSSFFVLRAGDQNIGAGPNAKSYILGLLLIQAVGIDVLRSAVDGLGAEIVRNPP